MLKKYILILVGIFVLTGCAPTIRPLFQDFQPQEHQEISLSSMRTILTSEGWVVVDGLAENFLLTEEKNLTDYGVYKTSAYLEITQINKNYVRVFIHPFRKYKLSGRKTKIPYLDDRIQQEVMAPLVEKFEKSNFVVINSQ